MRAVAANIETSEMIYVEASDTYGGENFRCVVQCKFQKKWHGDIMILEEAYNYYGGSICTG